MVERYLAKNTFVERLNLPSEVEQAVLEYHAEINNLPIDLDERGRTSFSGVLDTYSNLLLIARSPYRDEKKISKYNLTQEYYERASIMDSRYYFVGYKPKEIDSESWFSLCDAFGDCGFLKSFSVGDQSLRWVEVDYVFKGLADYYTSGDFLYNEPFVIGSLNPRTHDDYENFDRVLTGADLERLAKYLSMVSWDAVEECLLQGNYQAGDFEKYVMSDPEKARIFGRSEVIANVNRIYLGEKVTVEI